MSKTETFLLKSASGADLHGIAQWPLGHRESKATVVICHGFKGFMEWGFFPHLAELLVDRGFTVVRFNFCGNGMKPDDVLVTNPSAFRANTFSQDQDDLLLVLGAVGEQIAPGHVDLDRLALIGHSRGGGAALLAASQPEWRERIKALVTWSAVSTFDRLDDAAKEIWRRNGAIPIQNARTGQDLEIGVEVLEDLERRREELDLTAASSRRQMPWLIVHGSDDETVPAQEAEALYRHGAGMRELLMIDGANHTFGAQHPFAGPTPHLVTAMNGTQTWLRRYL